MDEKIDLNSPRLSPAKRALLERRLRGSVTAASKPGERPRESIPHRSDAGPAPLSFAQERLWFFHQIEPGSTVFNMPMAARIRGPLNVDALERTLNEIRRRHEVLRSGYSQLDGGQTVQVILDAHDEPLEPIDLSSLDAQAREAEARRLADQEADRPFDLGEGRFFRTTLIRLGTEDHLLLLTMHHIAFDGWSTGLLNRELEAIYGAFVQGLPSPLPEPAVQYGDYALWLREQIRGPAVARQIEYWKNQLRGSPAFLDLPADRPRPPVQTYHGGTITIRLPPNLVRELNELSQREGATLFMTFLAAFQLLLSRLSGQEDIVVGMPIANRNRVEIENLLGFFLNTLPLRTDVSGNVPFIELLQRARATTLGAFSNQDVPFEKLVEELHPERSLSHAPVFQVLLNMYDFASDAIHLSGTKVELLQPGTIHSKFDLTLYIEQKREGIDFVLVYNSDLFTHARMTELLAQFEGLLQQIAGAPQTPIGEFTLATRVSAQHLPDPLKPLAVAPEKPIHHLMSRHRESAAVALCDLHAEWSYSELESHANRIANFLIKNGVRKGDRVAVYGHRSAPLVAAMLGILKSGGAFVIFDPAYPALRLVESVRIAAPHAWIQIEEAGSLPPALEECLGAASLPRLVLPPGKIPPPALESCPTRDPEVEVGDSDPAYVAFTSGSTGKPKGVVGTHAPVSHFLRWHASTFKLDSSDRFALLAGLAHDPLLRDVFTPLSLGASLHIPVLDNIASTDEVAIWMRDHGITVAHLTPAFGQLLVTDERVILSKLRYGFFGADVLTRADVASFRRLAPAAACINFYGATETPQAIAWHAVETGHANGDAGAAPEGSSRDRIPLGRGIEGVQLLVVNRASRHAGVGELGELLVRTPHLSRGYLGEEALTKEKFTPNPFTRSNDDRVYRTGDLARYRPDGAVEFAGRADHQVKIRGFRVELNEVETALKSLTSVQDAAACVRATGTSGKQLIGYVVPAPGQSPSAHDLRLQLRDRLPDYMVPTAFVILDALPLTPNRKVDYRALPEPRELHPEREKGYVAPRDPVEELLAKIWEEVLGIEKVGIHDNFFDLGGHSLLSLQIINQIHKAGLYVTAPQFFQHPTIAGLASVATTAPAAGSDKDGGSSLVALRPRGTRPPLFLVHTAPGDVLGYINLVNLLGDDQPCYGFQSLGLTSLERAHKSIPEMASHYVKLLRRFQPEGPYYLAGWCFGGIVAMEMADQLIAQGQKIGILALFETWAHPPREGRLRFFTNRLKCFLKMGARRKLVYLKHKLRFYYAWYFDKSLVNRVIEERFGFSIAHGPLASREKVYRINLHASQTYPSRPFAGRITLLNAESIGEERIPDPTGGFATLVKEIDIHPVPGEHMSVLKDPHVGVLAAKLKECLRAAHEQFGVPPPPADKRPSPRAAPKDLSLTQNQLQVWAAQKLHPDNLYYHVAAIVRLNTPIDPSLLERAIRTLIRSSDALRTVIVERDGAPIARVMPEISWRLEQVDLTQASDPERQLQQWFRQRVSNPFNLAVRLFDFALVKLPEHKMAWYVAFHHLISDGWSIVLAGQKVSQFYGLALAGKLREVEPMPQFEDYVRQEAEFRGSERYRKNEIYWKEKLAGTSGTIPFHGRAAKRKSSLIRRITRELGDRRNARLRELASGSGSLPNLFFTLLAAYIHRSTGQRTFLLGVPFHNRRNRALKETLGFFSGVLPLRVDIAPDETFASLATRLRTQVIETIRHAPFTLQRADRAPGHDAIMNFHQTFFSEFAGTPSRGEWIDTGHGFEGLAVQVHSNDWQSGLRLELDFHRDVFSAEEAEKAAGEFLELLDQLLENPERALTTGAS